MSPETFVKRLQGVSSRFALTATDLSVWFGRPRATITTWLWEGRAPQPGAVLTECERRLSLLCRSRSFPVPYSVTKRNRHSYIMRAFKDADHAGVPSKHPAARGERALLQRGAGPR